MPSHFRTKSSVIHEKFDDETVIVNLDTGCYYSLLGTGDAIWTLAASGVAPDEIVARICAAYRGDAAEMAAATTTFLDQIVSESLLERVEGDDAASSPDLAQGGAFVAPSLQKYTDMEELLQLDPIHEVDKFGWPSAKPRVA